ncbi:hypothetical protein [Bacillus glycinifermentans]|uniref:hypothetical protein n=1 Tax=Bacillus glycinifermentans TaxID=1664069 RepID=UPI000A61D0C9|nr:hypothetical protein [Bacillus glycinifermentans]
MLWNWKWPITYNEGGGPGKLEEEIKRLRFQHTREAGSSMVASRMKEVAAQAPVY